MKLLTLWLIDKNIPLSLWRKKEEDFSGSDSCGVVFEGWNAGKELKNVVAIIVNSMSHHAAVELVAREWDSFPSILRMRLTQELNAANGTRSGNKTKGILRLNEKLGGRVLSKVDDRLTDRDLRVIDGRIISRQRPVNPAVAGAMRAHGAFTLPSDFDKMSPAAKRKIRKQQAADRRRDRPGKKK